MDLTTRKFFEDNSFGIMSEAEATFQKLRSEWLETKMTQEGSKCWVGKC